MICVSRVCDEACVSHHEQQMTMMTKATKVSTLSSVCHVGLAVSLLRGGPVTNHYDDDATKVSTLSSVYHVELAVSLLLGAPVTNHYGWNYENYSWRVD